MSNAQNTELLTWNLPGNSSADLSFGVFKELYECRDQIAGYSFFIYSFCDLQRVKVSIFYSRLEQQ